MRNRIPVTGTREVDSRTVVGMLELEAPPGGSLRLPMELERFETLDSDQRVEWYDGVAVVNPPLRRHAAVARRLARLLEDACPPGHEVYLEWGWRLPEALLRPDIMVAPIDGPPDVQRAAPLLIVEVLSPGTRDADRGRKRELYAAGGLRCYWVADPETGTVEVRTGPELTIVQTIATTSGTTQGPIAVLIDPEALAAP